MCLKLALLPFLSHILSLLPLWYLVVVTFLTQKPKRGTNRSQHCQKSNLKHISSFHNESLTLEKSVSFSKLVP